MGNRVQLDHMGRKILTAVRNELYLQMHFMGPALNSLRFEMDLWTKTIGTDAVSIRFNPNYLVQTYLEHPYLLDRDYMHMLMHCLFRHMFYAPRHRDRELWDLCADIAVESVVDSMDYPVIQVVPSDFREEWIGRLKKEVGVLTAQRLYRYFSDHERDYEMEDRLAAEFRRDDHSFWRRMEEQEREKSGGETPPLPQEEGSPGGAGDQESGEPGDTERKGESPEQNSGNAGDAPDQGSEEKDAEKAPRASALLGGRSWKEVGDEWKDRAKRIEAEIFVSGKRASRDTGDLERVFALENRKRTGYREFLRQFTITREVAKIDPESFDYAFYNYGMQMYGNMPLIEENEYREVSRVQDLAIVIDTSASCQDVLVGQFLNETAAILANGDSFFRKTNIHVIECDERVQQDLVIHNPEEMRKYAGSFHVKGGGGTDFRPAFAYVDGLIRKGKIRNLKGLLYFTDGFGTYPDKPTPYETAFIFWKDAEKNDRDVPDWAVKLYLDAEGDDIEYKGSKAGNH